MAQQIEYPQYDGQPMDVPPAAPQHGEQTDYGVWRGATPDCGDVTCDYNWLDQAYIVAEQGDAQTRLTWHSGEGEWFCPRHYPQDSDENMSRAFAALADDIEAQYAADEQAAKAEDALAADLLLVYRYLEQHGGGIYAQRVFLGEDSFLEEEGDTYFKSQDGVVRLAAEWIRAQEAQR